MRNRMLSQTEASMKSRALLAGLALALAPAAAAAGGFARPNIIGAEAVGMGGAFAAVADDATAIYHNPAALSLIGPTSALVDLGLVVQDRRYQPSSCTVIAPDLPACPKDETTRRLERELTTPVLVPSVAFSTRFGGAGGEGASRFAVGFGVFPTVDATVAFSEKLSIADRVGVRRSTVQLIEFVPAAAYQVSDVLALGLTLRIGMGLFDLDATSFGGSQPIAVETNGVTAGVTFGALVRPWPWLHVAMVYRSPMMIGASGDIRITPPPPEPATNAKVSVDLPFPQAASLGVAVQPLERLRLSAQIDWTNWSTFEDFTLSYPDGEEQVYLDLDDTYTIHAGVDYRLLRALWLRAGYSFDSQAVPDFAAERQYIDGSKHTVAAGAGYAFGAHWRVDGAFEYLFSPERAIPESADTTPAALQNPAPGTYRASAYQVLFSGQYHY